MPAEITTTLHTMLSDEATHRDGQAREALFLTFSSDLGFFESQVLGAARSTGAAVTVIADAHVYDPDPRAVRAAGVRYGIGLASTPAVFHPKLTVVVGAKRAAVGIGSGNLTIGGWHLNDEVLTVVTGNTEAGCPPILLQVAEWLDDLAEGAVVRLGRTARGGLTRTANALRTLCVSAPGTGDAVRLLGNLRTSILSQLPREPVDELRMFAPFHDVAGSALEELIATLRPSSIRVAVQDRFTVIDPQALLVTADRHGVQLTFERTSGDSGASYRHGKLIEARRAGSLIWTLAGSPNLSPQALCRTVGTGGNCELALLDRPGHELYPSTTVEIPTAELKPVLSGPPSAEEEPITRLVRDGLLEAAVDAETITLTFARPIVDTFTVEISDYRTDPDQFKAVAELEPGRHEYSIDADPDWHYPVRLRIRLNGEPGPIHFVMRPDQVIVRSRGGGGVRVPDYDPDQIFADPRQATEWLSAVTELALQSQAARHIPTRAGGPTENPAGSTRHAPSWDDPVTWHAYVDDATQRLGDSMVGFALGGLPRLSFLSTPGRAAWEDDFATRAEDVPEEAESSKPDDGLLEEDANDTTTSAALRDFGSAERQQFRRWLTELVEPMTKLEAIDRGARARLMLRATRMKIWEPHTHYEWFELLLVATRALPGNDIPPPAKPQFRALAQVMLHELASAARAIGVSRSVRNKTAMAAYLEVESQLGDLLTPVDRSLLEIYTDTVRVKGTIPPDPELIAEHAAEARGKDPVVQTLRQLMLTYPELVAKAESDSVLSIQTNDHNPLLTAGRCLDTIPGDWAIFATSLSGRRAFVARSGTTMLTAELKRREQPEGVTDHVRFLSFVLSPLRPPSRVTAREDRGLDGSVRAIEAPRLDSPGVTGSKVLAALGVDAANVRSFLTPT